MAAFGTLIAIPTLFEIPLVMSFLFIGMGLGPIAALLVTAPSVSIVSYFMLKNDVGHAAPLLFFAVNNYGPHQIPGLNFIFHEPWMAVEEATLQAPWVENPEGFVFEDITENSGLKTFRRATVNAANPSYVELMGGGVAVADVDGDGHLDLVMAAGPVWDPHPSDAENLFFRNRGQCPTGMRSGHVLYYSGQMGTCKCRK